MYAIKMIAHPNFSFVGDWWLASYDPDGQNGSGDYTFTENVDNAMKFPSFIEASVCWRQQSTVAPVRMDNKPNRPLTAFSVEFTRLP